MLRASVLIVGDSLADGLSSTDRTKRLLIINRSCGSWHHLIGQASEGLGVVVLCLHGACLVEAIAFKTRLVVLLHALSHDLICCREQLVMLASKTGIVVLRHSMVVHELSC